MSSPHYEEEEEDLDALVLEGVVGKKDEHAGKRRKIDSPVREAYTEADFDDGFDEDLRGDEEDRRRLAEMSEVEREQILLQRYERRQQLKLKRERMLSMNRLKGQNVSPTRSSRSAKSEASKSRSQNALSEIKAIREAKKEKDKVGRKEKLSATKSSDYPSINSSSDTPYIKGQKSAMEVTPGSPENLTITYNDIIPITLERSKIEKFSSEPFYEKAITGCFARVSLGITNGKKVYRFGIITGTAPPQIKDSKKLLKINLKHGVHSKSFLIQYLSDQPPTQSEFNKWLKEMKNCDEALPSQEEIKKKAEDLQKYNNYTYTDEEITQILNQRANNIENIDTMDIRTLLQLKAKLSSKLEALEQDSSKEDSEELEETRNQLKKVENRLEFLKKPQESADKIKKINEKNRIQNLNKKTKVSKEKESKLDPFARKSTHSKGFFFIENNSPSGNSTKSPQNTNSEVQSPKGDLTPATKSPGTSLVEVHDFDVDIDLSNVVPTSIPDVPKPAQTAILSVHSGETGLSLAGKKRISLADYKKSKNIH